MRGILLASCALTAVAAVVSRALRQPQVIAATCCAIAVSSHFLCWPHHQLAAAASVPTVVRTCGTFELHDLQFQGRGGTGTVYSATTAAATTTTAAHGLVLKVSGPTTAQAVIHECDVLRTLEARGVRNGVEQCLATCPGPTSIVLVPFVPGATASLSDPRLSPAARVIAVRSLGTTVVDAVLAGIASSDLQPLVDPRTGQTLLIDLSEAVVFADPAAPSYLEAQTARNFLSEYLSWVAEGAGDEEVTLMHEAHVTARQRVERAQREKSRGAGNDVATATEDAGAEAAATAVEQIVLDMTSS